MKILQINTVYARGSTGRIVQAIQQEAQKRGHTCYAAYRYPEGETHSENVLSVTSWLDCHIHNRLARLTMLQGRFSILKTLRFLQTVKRIKPDVVHLHNLHGNYINYSLFLRYLKTNHIPTVITLHDCWLMTGFCAHYDYIRCKQWQNGCQGSCPMRNKYGRVLFDFSSSNYKKKKAAFLGLDKAILITPSEWLKSQCEKSYLSAYPIRVINNGINIDRFFTEKQNASAFKKENSLDGKKIVLGVSYVWNQKKGLEDFIKLAGQLPSDYAVVLVGADDKVKDRLSASMLPVAKTESIEQLREWYNAADVFVNLTYEDTFPTVNLEALACGTPVVTYRSGGSAEMLDETCGIAVDKGDIDGVVKAVYSVCEDLPFSAAACQVKAESYNANRVYKRYIDLYEELVNE